MISKSLITFAKTFYPNKVIVIGSGDEDAATSFGEDTIQSTIVIFTQTDHGFDLASGLVA